VLECKDVDVVNIWDEAVERGSEARRLSCHLGGQRRAILADRNCGCSLGRVQPGYGKRLLQGLSARRLRSRRRSVELLGSDDDYPDCRCLHDSDLPGMDSSAVALVSPLILKPKPAPLQRAKGCGTASIFPSARFSTHDSGAILALSRRWPTQRTKGRMRVLGLR